MKLTIAILVAIAATLACFAKQPFERYQSILDRQMFGLPPDGFDPNKSPNDPSIRAAKQGKEEKELAAEQQKLKSAIHFSVINLMPDGTTAVGFSDNSNPKEPKHYYLRVGESRDGWLVKEANAKTASMVIVKNDLEVALTIGDNSANGGGKTTNVRAEKTQPTMQTSRTPMLSNSLMSRRRMRRQREEDFRKKQAEIDAAKEAERAAIAQKEREDAAAERAAQHEELMNLREEIRRQLDDKRKAAEPVGNNENNNAQ